MSIPSEALWWQYPPPQPDNYLCDGCDQVKPRVTPTADGTSLLCDACKAAALLFRPDNSPTEDPFLFGVHEVCRRWLGDDTFAILALDSTRGWVVGLLRKGDTSYEQQGDPYTHLTHAYRAWRQLSM